VLSERDNIGDLFDPSQTILSNLKEVGLTLQDILITVLSNLGHVLPISV